MCDFWHKERAFNVKPLTWHTHADSGILNWVYARGTFDGIIIIRVDKRAKRKKRNFYAMSSCDDFRANDFGGIIANSCSTLSRPYVELISFTMYWLWSLMRSYPIKIAWLLLSEKFAYHRICDVPYLNSMANKKLKQHPASVCFSAVIVGRFRLKRIPSSFFLLLTSSHTLALLYFIVVRIVIAFTILILSQTHTHTNSLCLVSHNFRCVRFFVFLPHSFRLFDFFCRSNGNSFII